MDTLARLKDLRMPEAAAKVEGRTESVFCVHGSFGWVGTLSEFGQWLCRNE